MQQITVLLLAGQRSNPGPLCEAYKAASKSVILISGKPMILYPLTSLAANRNISRIIVVSQQPELIQKALAEFPVSEKISFYKSTGGIACSVLSCTVELGLKLPLLITTADNCLLGNEDIDDFLVQAINSSADLAVGFARKENLAAIYPEVRRTWIQFRDVSVSGCNLFWLKKRNCLDLVGFWSRYESNPKKHISLAWAFGPVFFWRYLRRRVTLEDAFRKISAVTGVKVAPVLMKNPAVSIDADKVTDVFQIESVLDRRIGKTPVTVAGRESGQAVVIFDLDRTITRCGTYTPFLLHYALQEQPLRLLYAPLVAIHMLAYSLGLIDRRQLKTQMFRLFVGMPDRENLIRVCKGYVDEAIDNQVYADALYTIREWRKKGAHMVLATASYDWLANVFAQRLGFDHVVATRSILHNGKIVPGVDGENCYGEAKLRMVTTALDLPSLKGGSNRQIWFYTDHHTDIPLLNVCDHPVAVNATRKLGHWISTSPGGTAVTWRNETGYQVATPLLATVVSLCLALILFPVVQNTVETEISLRDVPSHVIRAVNREKPELHITEASVETQNSVVVYELEGTSAGYGYEIEVSAEGKILSIDEGAYFYLALKDFMG